MSPCSVGSDRNERAATVVLPVSVLASAVFGWVRDLA